MSGGDANSDGGAGSGNEQPGPLEGLRQLTQPFLTNEAALAPAAARRTRGSRMLQICR